MARNTNERKAAIESHRKIKNTAPGDIEEMTTYSLTLPKKNALSWKTAMIIVVLIAVLLGFVGVISGKIGSFSISIQAGQSSVIDHLTANRTDAQTAISTETPTPTPTSTPTLAPTDAPISISTLIQKGHYVSFGSYPQSSTDDEPILWKVLSVSETEIQMISNNVLDARIFGSTNDWKKSTLRDWLNKTFLRDAFSPEEQSALRTDFSDNSVTIPTKSEALSMSTITAEPTRYARANGVLPKNGVNASYITQTPSQSGNEFIFYIGPDATAKLMSADTICGVRPMISLNVAKLQSVSGHGTLSDPWRCQIRP